MSITIGTRIKNRRKEICMSVDDLAEKLGKNRATIYRYESDEIDNFPISVIEPLAKALHTTPAYLMGWDEEKAKPDSGSAEHKNVVRIAGRDGSYVEKKLSDEQVAALKTLIDQLPEADDL